MARNFRYYEKKRGHRRTGSRTIGSVGEAIFFAALLVLGCGGIVVGILWLVIPEWRLNHGFRETDCTILRSRVVEAESQHGRLYRPDIRFEYRVQDTTYTSLQYDFHDAPFSSQEEAQQVAAGFVERQTYPCWYDPADPARAVLVRGYQWWTWLVLLIPASFLSIGAGGLVYTLVHWGKSAERRAARARRTPAQELFEPAGDMDPKFPNVPDCGDITSSPGTRLAYRLPLTRSPGWVLFGLLVACVLWNGTVSVFVVAAVRSHLAGRTDWRLALFVLPFLVIGVVLIACFVRQLLRTAGIGPTLVEVSDHPLLPGGQYRLFLSQSGRLKMKSLEVALVCEEEAIYRQGTNTRTETREVFRQPLLAREGFEVRQGEPFEAECPLDVPPQAMHSFKANHNEIQWKLVVQGEIADWHDFQRTFPLIVRPAQATTTDGSRPS